jgi:hypothetical protein
VIGFVGVGSSGTGTDSRLVRSGRHQQNRCHERRWASSGSMTSLISPIAASIARSPQGLSPQQCRRIPHDAGGGRVSCLSLNDEARTAVGFRHLLTDEVMARLARRTCSGRIPSTKSCYVRLQCPKIVRRFSQTDLANSAPASCWSWLEWLTRSQQGFRNGSIPAIDLGHKMSDD